MTFNVHITHGSAEYANMLIKNIIVCVCRSEDNFEELVLAFHRQ